MATEKQVKTISKIWGYSPPPAVNCGDLVEGDDFPFGRLLFPQMIYGIEWEIERGFSLRDSPLSYYIQMKSDDSLRNLGVEYTACSKGRSLEWLIHKMDDMRKAYGGDFGERTSTHVHVNAHNMTPFDVYNFVLLAVVLEDFLYTFTNAARKEDVYCVPLKYSIFPQTLGKVRDHIMNGWRKYKTRTTTTPSEDESRSLVHAMSQLTDMWSKYTGVNFQALSHFGTVEFRHLHGTTDPQVIIPWLNVIGKMKLYAMKRTVEEMEKEISELNTNSEYERFLRNVFGTALLQYFATSNIRQILEDGTMAAKLSFLPSANFLGAGSKVGMRYLGNRPTLAGYRESSLGKAIGMIACSIDVMDYVNDGDEDEDHDGEDEDGHYVYAAADEWTTQDTSVIMNTPIVGDNA